jgi:tRNA-uridine 2-sulfurtransferase
MKTDLKKNKKVIVAMSGGVDSSVAAAMLKSQGFEVVGLFMHFWSASAKASADKKEKENEAKRIAKAIGIPLYIIDIETEFKKEVVDYFLRELKKGNTPNPCIMCNKRIKFQKLFETMLAMKFDFIATGHYARIKRIMNHESRVMNYGLFEAKDKNKDQSYFLYNLTQKQLSRIIFPVGEYTKPEIRKMAEKFNLPVADKPESQDICFIPEKEPNEFIKRNLKVAKGKIVDTNGKILGEHQGIELYTIGQRKGLNIGGKGPYFVVRKDLKNNRLIVTNNLDNLSLFEKEIEIKDVNWTVGKPEESFKAKVKVRYRKAAIDAIIKPEKDSCLIKFSQPQKAVTPGQSAVIYSKNGEVLGGGVIQ